MVVTDGRPRLTDVLLWFKYGLAVKDYREARMVCDHLLNCFSLMLAARSPSNRAVGSGSQGRSRRKAAWSVWGGSANSCHGVDRAVEMDMVALWTDSNHSLPTSAHKRVVA
jgi:hypothetical protein